MMDMDKNKNRASTPNPTDLSVGSGGAEIKIRCSPRFKSAFKAKAKELDLSMSELVRKAYLRIDSKIERKVIHQADPKLILELSKIGNNLNQIARAINTANHDGSTVDLVKVLSMLESIKEDLDEVKNGNF